MAKDREEIVFCLECRHSVMPGYMPPVLAPEVAKLVCAKRTADFVQRGQAVSCRCSALNFDGDCLAFEKIPPIEPGEMTPGNQE